MFPQRQVHFLSSFHYTVDSRYNGHHQDQDLVSMIESVTPGVIFSNFYSPGLTPVRNNRVSVIVECSQGES